MEICVNCIVVDNLSDRSSVVIDKPFVDTLLIKHNFSQNLTYRQGCSIVNKSNTTES